MRLIIALWMALLKIEGPSAEWTTKTTHNPPTPHVETPEYIRHLA